MPVISIGLICVSVALCLFPQVCTLLSGLVVACDYENGRGLLEDKDFSEFRSFFRHVFETVNESVIYDEKKASVTHEFNCKARKPPLSTFIKLKIYIVWHLFRCLAFMFILPFHSLPSNRVRVFNLRFAGTKS